MSGTTTSQERGFELINYTPPSDRSKPIETETAEKSQFAERIRKLQEDLRLLGILRASAIDKGELPETDDWAEYIAISRMLEGLNDTVQEFGIAAQLSSILSEYEERVASLFNAYEQDLASISREPAVTEIREPIRTPHDVLTNTNRQINEVDQLLDRYRANLTKLEYGRHRKAQGENLLISLKKLFTDIQYGIKAEEEMKDYWKQILIKAEELRDNIDRWTSQVEEELQSVESSQE